MSRNVSGSSRSLGNAPKPAPPQPGGATTATKPRRSAGAVPGIARTASSLRQSSPLNPQSSSLASLPAHLRNLSTPRIPSPLGKGTPARQAKQSLPVRTSKTTERHILLPEDPQLAPIPHSPIGSQTNLDLVPPPRAQPPIAGPSHRHQPSGAGGDERSDAEKMTKREREENRLPRLTAYATAESYRLKLLQAFLKREHGVGVVRVFDDCVYAVYTLPLLPGYGASTTVRSSPAVKSPGGVSLLERMTLAEDMGYDDSYFPSTNMEDPMVSQTNPSEYILSHSPPSPLDLMSSLDVQAGHNEEREQEIEAVQERLETSDGLEDALGLRAEEEVGVKSALEHGHTPTHEHAFRTEHERSHEPDHGPVGTHMDPSHPGFLEHIPSTAYSPQELSPPPPSAGHYQLGEDSLVHAHPHSHSHLPQRPRRKSMGDPTGKIAEAVFFEYGVSVFFGFQEGEERDVMEDCEKAGVWVRGQQEDDWEVEEFHSTYDPEAEYPRIYNDMFTFKSHSHLFKLSLAHAVAQSTKLSIYESIMQESLSLTSSLPKELSTTGHLQMSRRQALKMTGRLFKLRMDVNLIGGILDTPELFWSEASLYPLYEAIREYLEIGPRVQVLNDRLSVAGDLLEVIHEYIEERGTDRITWIIIWLIVVACLVEVGEVVARLVFHSIPRDQGEFLLVKGGKALMGAVGAVSQ